MTCFVIFYIFTSKSFATPNGVLVWMKYFQTKSIFFCETKVKKNVMAAVEKDLKITVLGSGGVGKSAITLRVVNGFFEEAYDPTIEDSYQKKLSVDGKTSTLDILDTAGQEEYQALQDQWIREGMGFVVVFAINKKSTLDEAEAILTKIGRIKDTDKYPIVILGNKCDLPDREVSEADGKKFATSHGFKDTSFFEVSAKEDINIAPAFEEIVRQIRADTKPGKQPTVKKSRCNIL
jgi:GTPase KRas protein